MDYFTYQEKVWNLFSPKIRNGDRILALIYLHSQLIAEINEVVNADSSSEREKEIGDTNWYATNLLTINKITCVPNRLKHTNDSETSWSDLLSESILIFSMLIKHYYHNKPLDESKYLSRLEELCWHILHVKSTDEHRLNNILKLEERHGTTYNASFYQGKTNA